MGTMKFSQATLGPPPKYGTREYGYKNQESDIAHGNAFLAPEYEVTPFNVDTTAPHSGIITSYKNHETHRETNVEPHEQPPRRRYQNYESSEQPLVNCQYGPGKEDFGHPRLRSKVPGQASFCNRETENGLARIGVSPAYAAGETDGKPHEFASREKRAVYDRVRGHVRIHAPGFSEDGTREYNPLQQGPHRTSRRWTYHNQESADMTVGHESFPLEKIDFSANIKPWEKDCYAEGGAPTRGGSMGKESFNGASFR